MLGSDYPKFRLLEHSREECILLSRALQKLGGRIYRRVNLPPQSPRDPFKCAEDITVREAVADDYHVDIAAGFVRTFGNGPKDKGDANRCCSGVEGIAQRFCQADRFQHDISQFREQRRRSVCLVVLLMADAPRDNQSTVLEPREFALCGAGTGARRSNQFRGVEAAVWRAKEHTQHPLLCPGEQRIRQALSARTVGFRYACRAQYGHNHALFGHRRQELSA